MTLMSCESALNIQVALQELEEMVRGERAFDGDWVASVENRLLTLSDEYANSDLVSGLLNVQLLWYHQMLWKRTVPASIKAIRWSRQLNDRRLLGKALIYRAGFAIENDELSGGLAPLLEALDIGKQMNDAERIAGCYASLYVVMSRLGRYSAALACIDASLKWCDQMSADPAYHRARAMHLLADLRLRQGDWRAALVAARESQALFAPARGDWSGYAGAIHNEVSALVHLLDFDRASGAIDRLSALSLQHPSGTTHGLLQLAIAEYEGFLGNIALAEQTLRSPDFPDREDALRVLVDIYEHAEQPDKALDVANELLGHLRAARQQVTQDQMLGIDVATLDTEDSVVRDLIKRSAELEIDVQRLGDRLHAKLAYLCELGASAELREEEGDIRAGEHIYRVGRLCAAVASKAGCNEEVCWMAELSGRLHDIGKMSLPSHIVLKRRPLSTGERNLLRCHAEDGATLVSLLGEARLSDVVTAIRHHHEHWNGKGYPSGLSGEHIPLLSRIVAVCDSFDAMTHWRPYKSPRSIVDALEEIERCSGDQFDPNLVGIFVNLIRRLQVTHDDLDEYLGEAGRPTRWAKSYSQLIRSFEKSDVSADSSADAK